MPVLCQEYMLFFCLPLSSQPRLNLLSTQQQGRAPPLWRPPPLRAQVEPWLTTQWQTENDMSSTSGYMGAKYVQEFGPVFVLHVLR